jgi:hypothetical protein
VRDETKRSGEKQRSGERHREIEGDRGMEIDSLVKLRWLILHEPIFGQFSGGGAESSPAEPTTRRDP